MPRRRRRRTPFPALGRLVLLILAIPLLYLFAALIGGLVPLNRDWREPEDGITIYLADNGVHADLILPVRAEGLDWAPLLPRRDFADPPPSARWVAFGAGERRVYLDTPTWSDLTLRTALGALIGGERVVHVEWVADPGYSARTLRLRPHEYRRLWAALRAEFRDGRPQRIAHAGYGPNDAFYLGVGKASALSTCNQWVVDRLRLAGVTVPVWSPFVHGVTRWYREADHNT
jgi:uncharacterized protein (TIGR02117 family)